MQIFTIVQTASDSKLNEKISAGLPPSQELSGAPELVLQVRISPLVVSLILKHVQINQFTGSIALPNLRKFLVDNDKVVAACANIVYYIVNPAMKSKSKYAIDLPNYDAALTFPQTYGNRRCHSADRQGIGQDPSCSQNMAGPRHRTA